LCTEEVRKMSVNKRDMSGIKLAGLEEELKIVQERKVEVKKRDPKAFVAPEKVTENWGASAGAGSDYFHGYRKKREFQMERELEFEKEFIEEKIFDDHQAKRLKGMQEDETRTSKKRDKRQRRKAAKVRNAQQKEMGKSINAFESGISWSRLKSFWKRAKERKSIPQN